MPIPSDADIDRIDAALRNWQQGDLVPGTALPFAFYSLATAPLSFAAQQTAAEPGDNLMLVETTEAGFVLLTQTCDVVRSCRDRPFVDLAPLMAATPELIEECRRLKRVSPAYHPVAAVRGMVVDLDRSMTIEKAVISECACERGLATTTEMLAFQEALKAKWARFAFPDDFVAASSKLTSRIKDKAGRKSAEGQHLDAIDEIRVAAAPDWEAAGVALTFWLVKRGDPPSVNWPHWTGQWSKLVDTTGRFASATMRVATLDDITARDYVTSHNLDFDQLSVTARP